MIHFVNAKINIGLQIVGKRPDGYHNLQTVFYPVGMRSGTAANPDVFCDMLEVSQRGDGPRFLFEGRKVDCPPAKNLVCRAAELFFDETGKDREEVTVRLYKNLPDGAGMGGGSADASFTLRALAEYYGMEGLPLADWALRLGADCPFFITNAPAYAEGVGERLEPLALDLSGRWMAVVKPDVSISTKEAFAGIRPAPARFDLRRLPEVPIEEWQGLVVNDFEQSLFPKHPELAITKGSLYRSGALYASMTGSGSCVYGIFDTREGAEGALREFDGLPTIAHTYLLEM